MKSKNIVHQTKVLAHRRRNRSILRLRLWSGIKEVIAKPWKGILILLLCAAFIFLWSARDTLVPFHSDIPLLITVWDYIIAAFIPLLFLLLLVGLLLLLGTPFRAKAVESSLLQIGLANRYGYAPALISCRRIKNTQVSVMAFYSLGVGTETWETHRTEIQDALNVHFVEPIKYGGRNGRNRNIIVITAAPGAEVRREDVLHDDEF
ncbi:hypothetical protein [Clostridium sp. KNHs216]|uniref:hypothetical protein n=1 Tax=Clostridium sp. KNHs216 TaxID=1550235 RepID=UPI001152DE90|nr:hypothetical protein [Clostridium sp. KNHs216]TQI69031.1 hypothetical protein LY85_3781 [Clostridium sp. KNHs216]